MAIALGMSDTIAALFIAGVIGEVWIGNNVRLATIDRVVGTVGISSWVATTKAPSTHVNMAKSKAQAKSISDVIERDEEYLERNTRTWQAETDSGLTFKDNFVEFLMLEATGNWRLVDLRIPAGKWNYFGGKAVVTTDPYPEDIDTTSIASTILKPIESTAHKLLDEILACENEDGIIPLYFQKERARVCIEVCANVCTFFYTYGRGDQVRKTFNLVLSTLKKRDFGTKRYYFTLEPLMYYCLRMVSAADTPELTEMRNVLRECVTERIGSKVTIGGEDDNAVCLAIRLLICQKLGIPNSVDLQTLLALQRDDGSFGVGWYYNFGRSKVKIGHCGFTATLAVEAIKGAAPRDVVQGAGGAVSTWGLSGYLTWMKNCLWWIKTRTVKKTV
ncbi:hypothetical protein CC80DRAFT_595372 [Byssothecium circinans]|uniref:Terpenoid cyclases/Protein prenyltransferase n=1 Tax=Byssothecium circinans TaxID=147558 RepID=A0A6A5TRC2_9PLEO|nr:hypothetical protein CC80DRAFT_595372 [Byssothecium circinans]